MAHLRYTREVELGRVPVAGFPLILTNTYAVHWLSLNYLLEMYSDGAKLSSIKTYAQHLGDFISQLEVECKAFDEVNEEWLKAYRLAIQSRGNTENYTCQVLRTCVTFLKWLEDSKYIRMVVGEGALYKVRITIGSKNGISHPCFKNESKNKRRSTAPRIEWIDIVKAHGPKRYDLAARFELMMSWGHGLGLRAFEVCNLKISQLPLRETAEKAIRGGVNLDITLTETKGDNEATIPVSPFLIKQTWDFIDIYRGEVTSERARISKLAYESYEDPGYIFLSKTTGSMLKAASFSNSVRNGFLAAVEAGELTCDERVWLHGLRHNFTVGLLKGLDDAGVRRPEAVARQATRHGSDDAMEPYLTDRFNRDFHG